MIELILNRSSSPLPIRINSIIFGILKSQLHADKSAALHQLETLSLIQIAKVRLMFHAGFDETKIEPSHFALGCPIKPFGFGFFSS